MLLLKNYLSLIKFSHTVFAMPFAVIGFFLGLHAASPLFEERGLRGQAKLFFLVILCMVFARSSAMAFNRWADSKFDKENIRTKIREIPSGIISPANALAFVITNCVLFVATTFFIDRKSVV